jgi:hypothetical protein
MSAATTEALQLLQESVPSAFPSTPRLEHEEVLLMRHRFDEEVDQQADRLVFQERPPIQSASLLEAVELRRFLPSSLTLSHYVVT